MNTNRQVDLFVKASWVLPVEPADTILQDHVVVVDAGRILEILPDDIAEQRYAARATTELNGQLLLPGLVNLHTHAAMSLFRGLADDLGLMEWLSEHIWPAETRHVSEKLIHDGTLLACAEMLKSGVTCFNDMYFFPEQAGLAAITAGMRVALGIVLIEFPTPYASDAQDYLRKGLAARDALKSQDLVSFCMAPHAPYTVSDASFNQVGILSEQLDLPVHIHLHETEHEIKEHLKEHGVRPLERMRRLGLIGPRLVAVHSVHLDHTEIALLAAEGASVAHCPASNLKLASGFARIGELNRAGVNVGIGTDGAASNNRLDVLGEMRLAALVAKAVGKDARTLDAHTVVRMATLNGARALGLDKEIGSLEPGKSADMIAVGLSQGVELSPCYDPASHLIYAAGREHVTNVWVRGRQLVTEGQLLTCDEDKLRANARSWQHLIAAKD